MYDRSMKKNIYEFWIQTCVGKAMHTNFIFQRYGWWTRISSTIPAATRPIALVKPLTLKKTICICELEWSHLNLLQRSSRDYGSDWSPTNLLASCCCHVHIGDANTKTIAKCSCSSDTAAMCATNGAEKVIETIDTESIAGMQSSPETSEPFLEEEEEELKWNPTTLTSHVIDWINRVRSSPKMRKTFGTSLKIRVRTYTL